MGGIQLTQDQILLMQKMHAYGLTNRKIADFFKCSIETVSNYCRDDLKKYVFPDTEKEVIKKKINGFFRKSNCVTLRYFVHEWMLWLKESFPHWWPEDKGIKDISNIHHGNLREGIIKDLNYHSSKSVVSVVSNEKYQLQNYIIKGNNRNIINVTDENKQGHEILVEFEKLLILKHPENVNLEDYSNNQNNKGFKDLLKVHGYHYKDGYYYYEDKNNSYNKPQMTTTSQDPIPPAPKRKAHDHQREIPSFDGTKKARLEEIINKLTQNTTNPSSTIVKI